MSYIGTLFFVRFQFEIISGWATLMAGMSLSLTLSHYEVFDAFLIYDWSLHKLKSEIKNKK